MKKATRKVGEERALVFIIKRINFTMRTTKRNITKLCASNMILQSKMILFISPIVCLTI